MTAAAEQNHMRLQALMAQGLFSPPRAGLVSSYDPDRYAVKVKLQPEETETGWLPIVTAMAGNGFGVYFGPEIDDQAVVAFLEGSVETGVCLGFLPSDIDRPPSVPSGEGLVRHKDGAFLRFLPGAVVDLEAAGGFNVTANTKITGDLTVTGDVTDRTPGNTASMKVHRDAYNGHHHGGVQTGGGVTAVPDDTV